MKKAVIIGVLILVVVVIQMRNRASADERILEEMRDLIAELELYQANAAYLDMLVEREHTRAFDAAYNMGGRRRSASFNDHVYIKSMREAIVADCQRTKKTDLHDEIQSMLVAYEHLDE